MKRRLYAYSFCRRIAMVPRTGANKPGGESTTVRGRISQGRKSQGANRLEGETAKGRISHNSFHAASAAYENKQLTNARCPDFSRVRGCS